jgi:hypothetical protein
MKGPLFIFGFPRSGTTLLRAVLGQHTRIQLVNEPEIIFALRYAGLTPGSTVSLDARQKLLKRLMKIGLCRRHLRRLPTAVVAQFLTKPAPMSFREIYETLLPKPQAEDLVWGEKSLNNLFFVGELKALYPGALMVHIVRDARGAILSYYRKKMRRQKSPEALGGVHPAGRWPGAIEFFATQSVLWQRWLNAARGARERCRPGGWIEVRFEDLLQNPRAGLEPICEAVGLDFEPQMIDPRKRRHDPVLETDAAYAHRNISRALDPSRALSHETLPPHLAWIIEREAGSTLEQYGYPLQAPKPTLYRRMMLLARLAAEFPRRRRKIGSHLRKRGRTPAEIRVHP